jgi:hypothetical protein
MAGEAVMDSLPIIGAEDKGSWLKVAVGICARGEWSAATAVSMMEMAQHFARGCAGQMHVIPMNGFIVPEMRSRIWAEAEMWGATHVLYVDADMGFPDDSLLRLLRHGKPVVGVNYPRKSFPYVPTAYGDTGDEIGPVYTREDSTGLQQVKHLGFGLVLIEIGVFDQLLDDTKEEREAAKIIKDFVDTNKSKIPSHMREYLTKDRPSFFHFDSVSDGKKWITEDIYFSRRCAQKGVPLFIDHDLSKQIRHIGQFSYQNYNSVACEKAIVETWAAGIGKKAVADIANSPERKNGHKSLTDFGPLIRPDNPVLKTLRETVRA